MPLRIFLFLISFLGLPIAMFLKNSFVNLFDENSFGAKHFLAKAEEEAAKPKAEQMSQEDWLKWINTKGYTLVDTKTGNKIGQE